MQSQREYRLTRKAAEKPHDKIQNGVARSAERREFREIANRKRRERYLTESGRQPDKK